MHAYGLNEIMDSAAVILSNICVLELNKQEEDHTSKACLED